MLFKKPESVYRYLQECSSPLDILDAIALRSPRIYPVFECVKVWCKLDINGILLFARDKNDILAGGRYPHDLISKFKNENVKQEAEDMLYIVSEHLGDRWPFFEGSSSWILLEMLSPVFSMNTGKNERTVILRDSGRLSYTRGYVKSPLAEKVFTKMDKNFVADGVQFTSRPCASLKDCAGEGFLTEVKKHDTITEVAINQFIKGVIEHNESQIYSFGFPRGGIHAEHSYIRGIDIATEDDKYVRVSLPLPTAGASCVKEERLLISDPIWRK